jgi:site-specific DNA recombinase
MTRADYDAFVGYIRMSTDQQQDSPARQRRDIEALAERLGYRIIDWYEDHGLTGTESLNRPKFQRLLRDAKDGKFEAVLLSEQSRMSREDIFDAMLHWRLLRDAGVKIVTCQRGELDFSNLGGVITAIVDQYGAHEESVKLAQRVVSGQRLRALQGKRIGGMVFGYDREVLDETGEVVRCVHFRERFCKPRNWTTRLVPSADRDAVKAVRWGFNAIRRGHSVGYLAREFNVRGLKTVYGNDFDFSSVFGILTNPAYAGALRAGYYKTGKFCSLGDEGMIVVENAHEAIVAPEIFEEVQRILAGRHRTYAPSSLYLLSGLIKCVHWRSTIGHLRIQRFMKTKNRPRTLRPCWGCRDCP